MPLWRRAVTTLLTFATFSTDSRFPFYFAEGPERAMIILPQILGSATYVMLCPERLAQIPWLCNVLRSGACLSAFLVQYYLFPALPCALD